MSSLNDCKSQTSRKSSKSYISRRLRHTDVLHYACKTWKEQETTAKSIATETMHIVQEAYEKNPAFFGSKSRKWILGGLFYLLGPRYGQAKTQKQIAQSLDTNEMTIRASYRTWLKHFSEFWPKHTNNHTHH
jgi:hypothetical protein